MWLVKTFNYFFILLLHFHMHVQGNVSDGCILQVMYARATFNYSIGDTLELNCTVKFCKLNLNIYWCKIEANNCEPLITNSKENAISGTTFLVYKVFSVEHNDTGKYQCVANESSYFSRGHLITVYVHGVKADSHETSISEIPTNSTMHALDLANTPLWIFYIVIAIGTVSAIVFLIMITLFCIRNFHDPLEKEEPSTSYAMHQYHGVPRVTCKEP
ncbi:B- and T-lymphocyte attenuator-like isoform X2 [Narcine bancroftii]|uniref:B- and T-lymphocyte attenuator-like isoform X2 n=1 Tax=Narcine bancroftii TaxID=1343680 RepID=UPI0038315AF7